VWSKVFQGLDTPQEQIKKLKEILAELGMTGRMSMEQAKAIKERRELAQELGTDICLFSCFNLIHITEDVQAFAKAIETRESRTRSRTLTKGSRKADQSDSDDGGDPASDDSDVPKKRPVCSNLFACSMALNIWMICCIDECSEKYYGIPTGPKH